MNIYCLSSPVDVSIGYTRGRKSNKPHRKKNPAPRFVKVPRTSGRKAARERVEKKSLHTLLARLMRDTRHETLRMAMGKKKRGW